jgi:hypothetical protein
MGPAERRSSGSEIARRGAVTEASPDAIGRVARVQRVQRPAVQADIGAETVQFDEPLRGVVPFLAKRLARSRRRPAPGKM